MGQFQFYMIMNSCYTVSLLPAFVGCILTYKTEVPKIEAKRIIVMFLALLAFAILTDGINSAILVIYLSGASNLLYLVDTNIVFHLYWIVDPFPSIKIAMANKGRNITISSFRLRFLALMRKTV